MKELKYKVDKIRNRRLKFDQDIKKCTQILFRKSIRNFVYRFKIPKIFEKGQKTERIIKINSSHCFIIIYYNESTNIFNYFEIKIFTFIFFRFKSFYFR